MIKSAHKPTSINLLPTKKVGGDNLLDKILSTTHFLLISLLIGLFLCFAFYLKLIYDSVSTYNKIDQHLNLIIQAKKTEDEVDQVTARIKNLKTLQSKPGSQEVLANLAGSIPESVTLREIKLESGKLILSGSLISINGLRDLQYSLVKDKNLKNFTLTQLIVPSSRDPYYSFSVSCDVELTKA